MVLWITSFVDSGLMESDEEGKNLYQKIIVFSFVITSVGAPFLGLLADKLPPRFLIPTAFAMRAAVGYGFIQSFRIDVGARDAGTLSG